MPIARAAVSSSLEIATEGSGTSDARPSSRASSKSFCIMFTSNQISSGFSRMKGARCQVAGEASALLRHASTAVARNAVFLGQQDAFTEAEELRGQAEVDSDFH